MLPFDDYLALHNLVPMGLDEGVLGQRNLKLTQSVIANSRHVDISPSCSIRTRALGAALARFIQFQNVAPRVRRGLQAHRRTVL